MPLSRVLSFGLWLYLVILLVVYARVGDTAHVTGLTVLLMVALVVTLLVIVRRQGSRLARAYNLRMVVYLGMFTLPGLIGYLLYPEYLPFTRRDLQHGSASVNLALLLYIVGTVALVAGFARGAAGTEELPSPPPPRVPLSLPWLAITVAVFGAIELYIQLRFSYKYVGTSITEGQSWIRLFSFQPIAFLGTIYFLEHHREMRLAEKLLVMGPPVAWQFSRVLFGSRSSLIVYALLILCYYLVKEGDPRISRRVGMTGLALVLVAVITYPIGLAMRLYRAASLAGIVTFDASAIWAYLRLVYEAGFEDVLTSVFARLGSLDTMTVTIDGPLIDPAPFTGLLHDAKSFVNIILPGELFPGVIDGSSTWPIIYMGYDLSYFTDYQKLTMPWLIWGFCFIVFGWMLVIPALALAGWLSGRLMRWLTRRTPAPLRVYVQVWTFVTLYLLVENLGVDFWFAGIVYDLLPYVVAAPLLYMVVRRGRAEGLAARPAVVPGSNLGTT